MTLIQSFELPPGVSFIGNLGISEAGTYVISNGARSVHLTAVENFTDQNVDFSPSQGGLFTEGSALKIGGITVSAGSSFSFNYDFLTQEYGEYYFNDSFLLYVESEDASVSLTLPVASIAHNAASFGFDSDFQSGPNSLTDQTLSFSFVRAGTYEVTLVVLDSGDTGYDSTVSVDNFQLNGEAILPDAPSGINSAGDASVQGEFAGISPREGNFQYLITTGEASALAGKDAEDFTEGSGVHLEGIEASAGQKLTFDYNFLTNESPNPSYNDSLVLSVGSADGTVSETVTLASVVQNQEDLVALTGGTFASHTGYQEGSYTFSTAGTYHITFLVFDAGDTQIDSAALLDNIQLI